MSFAILCESTGSREGSVRTADLLTELSVDEDADIRVCGAAEVAARRVRGGTAFQVAGGVVSEDGTFAAAAVDIARRG